MLFSVHRHVSLNLRTRCKRLLRDTSHAKSLVFMSYSQVQCVSLIYFCLLTKCIETKTPVQLNSVKDWLTHEGNFLTRSYEVIEMNVTKEVRREGEKHKFLIKVNRQFRWFPDWKSLSLSRWLQLPFVPLTFLLYQVIPSFLLNCY